MWSKLLTLLLFAGAAWLAHHNWQFRHDGIAATGVVVGWKNKFEVGDEGVSLTRWPIVEFTPKGQAQKVRFRSDVGSAWRQYRKGESVKIIYPRDHPTDARIDSFMNFWFAPLILLVLGVASLLGRLQSDRVGGTWYSRSWED